MWKRFRLEGSQLEETFAKRRGGVQKDKPIGGEHKVIVASPNHMLES